MDQAARQKAENPPAVADEMPPTTAGKPGRRRYRSLRDVPAPEAPRLSEIEIAQLWPPRRS